MTEIDILSEKLDSSNIEQADYDQYLNVLIVKFKAGYCYEYYGVPKETFKELVTAKSVGKFFQTNIRNKFDYAKRGEVQKLPEVEEKKI